MDHDNSGDISLDESLGGMADPRIGRIRGDPVTVRITPPFIRHGVRPFWKGNALLNDIFLGH